MSLDNQPTMPTFSSAMKQILSPPKPTKSTNPFDSLQPQRCVAPLPLSPADAHLNSVHYFGFAFPVDLLVRYGASTTTASSPDSQPSPPRDVHMAGLRALREYSGIPQLELKSAAADPKMPARAMWCRMENGAVPVLVVCTAVPASYRWRPIQEKVDRLAVLIGHPPRWWVDFRAFRDL